MVADTDVAIQECSNVTASATIERPGCLVHCLIPISSSTVSRGISPAREPIASSPIGRCMMLSSMINAPFLMLEVRRRWISDQMGQCESFDVTNEVRSTVINSEKPLRLLQISSNLVCESNKRLYLGSRLPILFRFCFNPGLDLRF